MAAVSLLNMADVSPPQVCFIRDIPAPSPRGFRPFGLLATAVDPQLRVLTPEKLFAAGLGVAVDSTMEGVVNSCLHATAAAILELDHGLEVPDG